MVWFYVNASSENSHSSRLKVAVAPKISIVSIFLYRRNANVAFIVKHFFKIYFAETFSGRFEFGVHYLHRMQRLSIFSSLQYSWPTKENVQRGVRGCFIYYILGWGSVFDDGTWNNSSAIKYTLQRYCISITQFHLLFQMLRCMMGFILFIVILQSLRLLRYERLFLLFGRIYSRAHRELKMLAVSPTF